MKTRNLRNLVVASALLLLPANLAGLSQAMALGDGDKKETVKEDRPTIDETQVYFGKASTCKAPATVDADRVFRAIPEYKKILDDKLTDADARYSLLLVKATKKFKAAVEGAATSGGSDLVGNSGSVSWPGHDVPDLTDAAIRKVEEAEKAR